MSASRKVTFADLRAALRSPLDAKDGEGEEEMTKRILGARTLRLDWLELQELGDELWLATDLRELFLQHNALVSISELAPLHSLEVLVVSHNALESLKGLGTLRRLRVLDASSNKIAKIEEEDLPWTSLEAMSVVDNPVIEDEDWIALKESRGAHIKTLEDTVSSSRLGKSGADGGAEEEEKEEEEGEEGEGGDGERGGESGGGGEGSGGEGGGGIAELEELRRRRAARREAASEEYDKAVVAARERMRALEATELPKAKEGFASRASKLIEESAKRMKELEAKHKERMAKITNLEKDYKEEGDKVGGGERGVEGGGDEEGVVGGGKSVDEE